MSSKISDLIKGIFLASLASLPGSNISASTPPIIDATIDDQHISQDNAKPDLSRKLILKMNSDNSYLLAGHRSHRSHSSHRSHYSSRSGGSSSYKPSYRSSGSSNSTSYPATSNGSSSTQTTTNIFKLGDRILKKGMNGHDVTELRNILVKKEYLKLKPNELLILSGKLLFDDDIEKAVIEFQKKHSLTSDGIVGTITVYYLKIKDDKNSTN